MTGGVTCDPTMGDIYEAIRYLENVISFCEKEIFGISIDEFLELDSSMQIMVTNGTLKEVVETLVAKEFSSIGRSYDTFISFGENNQKFTPKKSVGTKVINADLKFVSESLENSFFVDDGYTYSKSAMYKEKYFEAGAMSRMMIAKDPLVKDLHRRYKDSVLTRVISRIAEIAHLLKQSKMLLENLDISEPSCISPTQLHRNITAVGTGYCEAARGTLIHKVSIKNGLIQNYDIITPTVWNLGNGNKDNPSIAQKAIIGLDSMEKANIVFKSFDVCAVCTTQ